MPYPSLHFLTWKIHVPVSMACFSLLHAVSWYHISEVMDMDENIIVQAQAVGIFFYSIFHNQVSLLLPKRGEKREKE